MCFPYCLSSRRGADSYYGIACGVGSDRDLVFVRRTDCDVASSESVMGYHEMVYGYGNRIRTETSCDSLVYEGD